MNRRHTWVTVAGLPVIGRDMLSAQVPQPPVRLWSVSVAASGGSGKSSHGVEAALQAGGCDETPLSVGHVSQHRVRSDGPPGLRPAATVVRNGFL